MLAGLRGSEETEDDPEVVMAPGAPDDRWSLRVDEVSDRNLSLRVGDDGV